MENTGTLPLPKAEDASNPRAGQDALMSASSCNICRHCTIKLTVLTQNPNPNLLKPCVSKSWNKWAESSEFHRGNEERHQDRSTRQVTSFCFHVSCLYKKIRVSHLWAISCSALWYFLQISTPLYPGAHKEQNAQSLAPPSCKTFHALTSPHSKTPPSFQKHHPYKQNVYKSKSSLNREKKTPKNQLQSVHTSKQASNDNSPHCKHTNTCCNCLLWKIRVPISSKTNWTRKAIPNSKFQ